MNAFYSENCLADQDFARDPSKSVGEVLKAENAEVTKFVRFQVEPNSIFTVWPRPFTRAGPHVNSR